MASRPDTAVRIAHETDNISGNVSYAANGFRALTGLQAFRGYDWMTDVRALNGVGDFRGMVVSARWATTYQVISPAAKALGSIALVASIAANTMDMAPQFEAVYRSSHSPVSKASKYGGLALIVAQKTLGGVLTGGVHLIYLPLIAGWSSGERSKRRKVWQCCSCVL